MKLLDIVYSYSATNNSLRCSLCRVRSFIGSNGIIVLLTELNELNDGLSVTNAIENIIDSLINQGYVVPPAIFIEHYKYCWRYYIALIY